MLRNPQHAYRHDIIDVMTIYVRRQTKKESRVQINLHRNSFFVWLVLNAYIIPPMPAPAGIAGVSSLMLATADSVVRNVEATLVAF